MADPAASRTAPAAPPLPPELEARIAASKTPRRTADFDGASWFWMILLGVVVPLALLAAGWWA